MSDGLAPLKLTDNEWIQLSKIADLPDAARGELENILGLGRFMGKVDAGPSPSALKDTLTDLREKAEALLSGLRDPKVMTAITFPAPRDDACVGLGVQPQSVEWTRLLESLTWAEGCLKSAETRISKGRTGNKTAAADVVTGGVDELLRRYKRRGLKRNETSSADPGALLLRACFKHLKLKKATPISAIRRLHAKQVAGAARDGTREASEIQTAEFAAYQLWRIGPV